MPSARAHHFVPEFLLAGFTPDGTREDYLCVSDLKTSKQWKNRPKETGHQRDFNRVEAENVPPNLAEEALSAIESAAAPVIAEIARTQQLPVDERGQSDLIFFVSSLATRVPAARSIVDHAVDSFNQQLLKVIMESPERWDSLERQMRADGRLNAGEHLSYEQTKEIIERGGVRCVASHNFQILTMLENAQAVFPVLRQRQWSLFISPAGHMRCMDKTTKQPRNGKNTKRGIGHRHQIP